MQTIDFNEIRNAVDIVDIINEHIPLTQKGKNFFGVCPFHDDHAPSMSVSREKQIYKCFSCGASGNVFTFIENYLNLSFLEAVSYVANKSGIEIKLNDSPKKVEHEELYNCMDLACKFYQNNLNSLEGEEAINYLEKRGLDKNTIKEFDIGLALTKSPVSKVLEQKGYNKELLEGVGLVNNNYDVFQNRIMFPIHNLDGKVVGFTARCYLEELTPKYLNSKETKIFKKGNILFNYHRAKMDIHTKGSVIVVEGNMDAIRLYANGIKNVVALMGTSLTKEQIEIIKKMRAKVILMLDNDLAGSDATYNVGLLLEKENISFSVVRLSDEKDPDSYVLKKGIKAIEENIKNAISFLDFKLDYFKRNKNLTDATDLTEYLKSILLSLENTSDELLKEVTLQKLANDYNISYDVLKSQLKTTKIKETPKKKIEIKEKTNYEKLAAKILFYMMHGVNFVKIYQTKLGMFITKKERMMANEIIYYKEKTGNIIYADFLTFIETNPMKDDFLEIINNERQEKLEEDDEVELIDKLKKIESQEKIDNLKEEIKQETDINKKIELMEKLREIKKGCVKDERD